MARRKIKTQPSTASKDWRECRAWRRMFLAVQDVDTDKARDALRTVAVTFAGLAMSYADTLRAQTLAAEARADAIDGDPYKALATALSAFGAAKGQTAREDHEGELCGLIRAVWPCEPSTFAALGKGGHSGSTGGEDKYLPRRYVAHSK